MVSAEQTAQKRQQLDENDRPQSEYDHDQRIAPILFFNAHGYVVCRPVAGCYPRSGRLLLPGLLTGSFRFIVGCLFAAG